MTTKRKKRTGELGSGLNRRQFMKRSALAAAGAVGFPYIVPASALGLDGTVAPSNRITMASIGVGGQGTANLRAFLGQADAQVLAVCDVDCSHRDNAQKLVEETYSAQMQSGQYKGCDSYNDFHEVLARDDVDGVCICTPDFWHAAISVAAAEAGKDMYCEKPLSYSVGEGRAVVNAMKRYGRVFQTGSHERSRSNARYACELVRNGRIGKLHTIHINMPIDNHGPIPNQPPMPVPDGFDYNFWLGPRPWATYTEKRCHFFFRYILDYSGGEVTDRGAHIMDIGQLGNATDHTGPTSIGGWGKFPRDGLFNTAMDYEFTFEYANGVNMNVKCIGPRGVKFEGTDGWVFVHIHGGNLEAEPASLLKEIIGPNEEHLGRSPGHHRDFLNNVKVRGECMAPPEVGHRTATMCNIANIAMRLRRKLQWDPDKEQFINDAEANNMLMPSMRGPWHV